MHLPPWFHFFRRSFPMMMNLFPERNLLPPEAISSVVSRLASDEAQHRTGCALPVDVG